MDDSGTHFEKRSILDESPNSSTNAKRDLLRLESEVELGKARKLKAEIEAGKVPESMSWMSTTQKVGLMGMGAYGVNRFSQSSSSESLPFLSTVLATMSVGRIIGPKEVKTWVEKKFGISISRKSLQDFLNQAKAGDILGAFDQLTLDGQYPSLSKTTDKLKISKAILIDLKDVKYRNFNDWSIEIDALGYKLGTIDLTDKRRKATSYTKWAINKSFGKLIPEVDIRFLELDKESKKTKEEIKLSHFIKKHIDRVGGPRAAKNMSIIEIIDHLDEEGILDQ